MIVYRVEHADTCCGPYNVPDTLSNHPDYETILETASWVMRNVNGSNHVSPYQEWGFWPHSSCLYGFASVEQLREWFDEEAREILNDGGYVVRAYNSDDVSHGTAQVAFVKSDPIPLTTYPLV